MDGTLNFDGKKFISAKIAAKNFGYTSDYVGQLCRAKKINSRLVGRSWYVSEKDLIEHKNNHHLNSKIPKYIILSKKDKIIQSKPTLQEKNIKRISDERIPKVKKIELKNAQIFKSRNLKSRIAEPGSNKILYIKDNEPLFPNIDKRFDFAATKRTVITSIDESIKRGQKRTFIEKFAYKSAFVLFFLVTTFAFASGTADISKFKPSNFGSRVGQELAFVYGSIVGKNGNEGINNYENYPNVNRNKSQLASSLFSGGSLQSVSGWVRETAYKIVEPWLSKDKPALAQNENSAGQIIVINQTAEPSSSLTTPTIVQAKTIYVAGSDREYVDLKIAELKNYFLLNPLAPNVTRYYVTKQNDSIINSISRSSGGTVTNITSGASTLSDLSDLTLTSSAYGDVLMYDGGKWVNTATSSLGISGTGGGTWGTITGTLSNQSDLSNVLYGKMGTSSALTLGQLTYVTGDNTLVRRHWNHLRADRTNYHR